MERHTVRIHNQDIHYSMCGDGQPVVLVHGLSGSSRWWQRNIPTLARYFRVYVVDLPGFGQLSHLRRHFQLQTVAGWLSSWMEAVGAYPAHLIGHSMGGYICLQVAARHVAAVRHLVLIAPAGLHTGRTLPAHVGPLAYAVLDAAPAFVPVLVADAFRAGPWTLWRAAQELLAVDARQLLPDVHTPTLLIWGERDTLVPCSLGEEWQRHMTDARLLIIPGASHVPMFDHPYAVNQALIKFLRTPATIGGP